MKILVGVAHPKHVHIFRNFIKVMEERGREVKIVAVGKDVAEHLLKRYGFSYILIGNNQPSLIRKGVSMIKRELLAFKIAKKFDPDILVGRAFPELAHVSVLLKKPFVVFEDTEIAKSVHKITIPFTDSVVTPLCYKGSFGEKHVRFNGYFELAYLHLNYFKPDPTVLDDLGLGKNDKFIVLRFVSWNASHDIGQHGIGPKMRAEYISKLEQYGRVLINSEAKLEKELEKWKLEVAPEKFHSLLSYAQLYIGEGGSTATEAAILGTPSIHVSSTAKYCGNFEDLHKNYKLIYTFSDDGQALEKAIEILEDPDSKRKWRQRREKMLKEKIDVTAFMTDFIENFPESFYELRRNEEENNKCSQEF